MNYVECPNRDYPSHRLGLFLAGGIVSCPPWQNDVIKGLKNFDINVFNPRRKNFPIHDPSASFEQIKWEFDMLRAADMISFWFSKETLGPIVLFELGAHLMTNKPIVIGIDPKYERKQDIEIQTKLIRSDIPIVYSIEDLINSISNMINQMISFG